ncbi:Maf family protein [Brevibacillus sp. B_LB10_24]|uniref:Maf family protein n=1 Tax=Brevibacillus sp. B_LB10_24 TaxID=3380645 RepID=UPI0038B7E4C4
MQKQGAATIILASTSPRRKELLEAIGLPFTVIASNVDETVPPEMQPDQVVEYLALKKAREVAGKNDFGLVIGSDTIVFLDGEILGKPRDEEHAFAMLQSLQGRQHTVYSGVAVVEADTGRTEVSHSAAKVNIRPMTDREIRAYIATGEPMDKAGSYAIQGIGSTIVEGIVGDYFAVVGLPLHLTARLLARFGVSLL